MSLLIAQLAAAYAEQRTEIGGVPVYSFTREKAPGCRVTLTVTNPTPEQLAATRKSLGVCAPATIKEVV